MEEIKQGGCEGLTNSQNTCRKGYRKQNFFQSYLQSQVKRFSTNALLNIFPQQQKNQFLKLFTLIFLKEEKQKSQQDLEAISKILVELAIFPEFKNDIKLIRMFSKHITAIKLDNQHYLFKSQTQSSYLYKIIKGCIILVKDNQSDQLIKTDGQFVEEINNFNHIKQYNAISIQQSFILSIPINVYVNYKHQYLEKKTTIKILHKNPLFNSMYLKNIEDMFHKSKEREIVFKEVIFQQNEPSNQIMFYIIEGEVEIIKKVENYKWRVRTISDGGIVGEQSLFDNGLRTYTAKVISSVCKVLCIEYKSFLEILSQEGKTLQNFISKTQYLKLMEQKLSMYDCYLRDSINIKRSFHTLTNKENKPKQYNQEINNFMRVGQMLLKPPKHYHHKNKKSITHSIHYDINLSSALFMREDFPQLKRQLKRYAKYESQAQKQYYFKKKMIFEEYPKNK